MIGRCPSLAATLTRHEREAPFAIGAIDPEPLPRPCRVGLVLADHKTDDGRVHVAFTEFDLRTGEILAEGELQA